MYNQIMSGAATVISPDSFKTFGELLRYLRKRAELTQRELSIHVGYHYSYMSRIENDEHRPDPATLMARFVPALGLEKDALWTKRMLDLATIDVKPPPGPQPAETGGRGAAAVPASGERDDGGAGRLPVSLTPLLGREEEIATLVGLLEQRDTRLITLIGPPGVGKTRLAVQAAVEAESHFAHGLRFIDLAPIIDPDGFLPALAHHLDVHESADRPLVDRLAQALRQKNCLLVLDNFEQLAAAAPQVYRLLTGAPEVRMLLTSRIPLHIAGEHQFTVRPLSVPETPVAADIPPSLDPNAFTAVRLFVERAAAVQPDFKLTPGNTAAVIEICRRLDGLPLAIELAAARVRALPPSAMLQQFEHRFEWLAPNYREGQASRQTLRGAIEWSHNLLSEKEQVLFRRLSVFSARRTVETVREVCADDAQGPQDAGLDPAEIFDLLIRLTDHSLLYTETQLDEVSFSFLETIHEFSREKLSQAGEEAAMRNRHLAYFCRIAERVELEVEYENQTAWLDRCRAELNNMRAALDWSLKDGADLETGLRLAASLGLYWYLHSHFVEGLERSKVFLAKAREFGDRAILAKLLFRTADLHLHRAEFEAARRLSAEAVAVSREIGDMPLLGWGLYVQGDVFLAVQELEAAEASLNECIKVCREAGYEAVEDIALLLLGTILSRQGELERAESAVAEGLALAERLADPWAIASGLRTLGEIRLRQTDYAEARRYFERSLKASRVVGDSFIIGGALVNLAGLANLQGRFDESDRYAEQALSIFQQAGDETQQQYPLRLMGYASLQSGNPVRARVLMQTSLAGNLRIKDVTGQLASLAGLAYCELMDGDLQEAVWLAALVDRLRREKNLGFHAPDEAALGSVLDESRAKLGEKAYRVYREQGRNADLDEILDRLGS